MKKTIWKFTLDGRASPQSIQMPKGAQSLSVQVQGENPCLWAIVNPQAEPETVLISIYGTGHNLPDNPGEFIGTFQISNGRFVFHVFKE